MTKHAPEIFASTVFHGQCNESIALQEFKETFAFFFQKHPYLAASPDAIIDVDKLFRIKCLYAA